MQEIAEGLKDVVDWEGLAGWLNVSSGTIYTIIENCDRSNTKAQCCRRELVKTYCDQRGGDPERVKEEIRHALESKMRTNKQGLEFTSVARASEREGVVTSMCIYCMRDRSGYMMFPSRKP